LLKAFVFKSHYILSITYVLSYRKDEKIQCSHLWPHIVHPKSVSITLALQEQGIH